MNLEQVRSKIEGLLKSTYSRDMIDIQQQINQNSIMGYDLFLKQLLFEVYYEYYLSLQVPTQSLHEMYKEKLVDSFEQSDIFVNDNKYAKLKRTYKQFRKHNDEIAEDYNLYDQVEYKELTSIEEKMKGHSVKEYQKDQLINLIDFELFKHIKNGTICRSKSVSDSRLIDMLKELDELYNRIEKNFPKSSFLRSVQYYQLEINCRLETFYYIATALDKVDRSLDQKKEDIKKFQSFSAVCNENSLFQTKFVYGIRKYIDEYVNNPEYIESIPQELFQLSQIKHFIRSHVLKYIKDNKITLHFDDIESICHDFFGRGQHIVSEKKWEDIKLINFRSLYQE